MLHQGSSQPLIAVGLVFFPCVLFFSYFKILLLRTVLKSVVPLPDRWGRGLQAGFRASSGSARHGLCGSEGGSGSGETGWCEATRSW